MVNAFYIWIAVIRLPLGVTLARSSQTCADLICRNHISSPPFVPHVYLVLNKAQHLLMVFGHVFVS